MCHHTFKRSYTNSELAQIIQEVEVFPGSIKNIDTAFIAWRHSWVKNYSLFVAIGQHGEAIFYVNGEPEKVSKNISPQRGALIWRWLIEAWQDILITLDPTLEVYCHPEVCDGLGERRVRMFEKLGFEGDDLMMTLVR